MAAASHSQLDRFDQMTVFQLRSLLREHKLPISGLKADLVDRARTHQLSQKVPAIPPKRQKVTPIQPPPSQQPSPIPPPSQRPSSIPAPPQRPGQIPAPPQRPSPIPAPPQRPSPIPAPPQRPSPIPAPPQRPSPIPPPPQRPSPIPLPPQRPGQIGPLVQWTHRDDKIFKERRRNITDFMRKNFPALNNHDFLTTIRVNLFDVTPDQLADLEYLKHLIESNRLLIVNNGEITMIQGFLALHDGEVLLHPKI